MQVVESSHDKPMKLLRLYDSYIQFNELQITVIEKFAPVIEVVYMKLQMNICYYKTSTVMIWLDWIYYSTAQILTTSE